MYLQYFYNVLIVLYVLIFSFYVLILAKDYNSAKSTLNSIKNADAITSYLKAVLAARTGDTGALASNLKNAIQQDATLAARAAKDLEFAKYASTIKDIVK